LIDDLLFFEKYYKCIKDILSIIDLGFNFVPCQHLDTSNIFYNIIKDFDKALLRFNRNLFFKKLNDKNSTSHNDNLNVTNNFEFITELNSCSNFSCFFKKLKKNSSSNIPFLKESLEFRFQFIRELSKHKILNNVNLNKDQFNALKFFIKHKPFRVLEADKNIGAVLISEKLEIELALKSLNDSTTYRKLDYDPLLNTQNLITRKLDSLSKNGNLSNKCKKYLVVDNPKCGLFRILIKLHKQKLGVREIINCINTPISNICLLFFLMLQPHVIKTPSYLQDSQHLLQLISVIDFSKYENLFLYSIDFVSLYSSIEKDLGISLILQFMSEVGALDPEHIDLIAAKELLYIIFECNIFSFKKDFYIQTKGVAMGIICGPVIANIVVYMLERKWLHIHKPIIYRRFIDDVGIFSDVLIDLDEFRDIFGNLKLTIAFGQEIQFLDLKISFDYTFRRIITSLYIKPTNTFSYLSIKSNHKLSIFRNIPASLFIRIRRICSESHDYLYFSRLLIFQLIQRGYDFNFLINIARNVFKLDRSSLLPYKAKNDSFKDFFLIIMPFNRSNISLDRIIYNSFSNFNNVYKLKNVHFKIVHSVNNNLRQIFVHNSKLSQIKCFFNCSNCSLESCRCCKFIENKNYLFFTENFSLPILSNSNCKSKNCVYIINCIYCNSFYIGETVQTMEKRLDGHISNIRCFIPYLKETSEVALHFNKKGHNFLNHLKVSIFISGITNDEFRLDIESELIHLFLTLGCKVINAKILRHIERFFSKINLR